MSRRLTWRGQAEDQVKASWWTHARARGGGSAASVRGRRLCRITSPCVMTIGSLSSRWLGAGRHGSSSISKVHHYKLPKSEMDNNPALGYDRYISVLHRPQCF